MWNQAILFMAICLPHVLAMELRIEISSPSVARGDDVTVKCRIDGYTTGGMLYWWKRQGSEEVQMGTLTLINDLFADRHSVQVQQLESSAAVVFLLNIRGVQLEDNGEFGCSIPTVNNSKTYVDLVVQSPVQSMELWGRRHADQSQPMEQFSDGHEITFEEGDSYDFRCIATGSNPAPTMTVTFGYGHMQDDLQNKFAREDTREVDPTSNYPGLRRFSYTSTMTTVEPFTIEKYANSLIFTCTASVPTQDEPLSVSVMPVLKFPPSIKCPRVVKLPCYEMRVSLECEVTADPPLTTAKWLWFNSHGVNTTLLAGQSHSRYRFNMLPGVKPDTKVASLWLGQLFPQMFRTYTLIVANDRGLERHTVKLVRDTSKETYTGSAPGMRSSALLVALTGISAALTLTLS